MSGGWEGTMTGMKRMGARPEQSWLVGRDVVDMTRPAKAVRPIKLAALPQNIVVDANKSARIVVDMQTDFCAAGGWMDSQGIDATPNKAQIEQLKALVGAFRAQGQIGRAHD